jgi:glucose/arabinose dehydrogenase
MRCLVLAFGIFLLPPSLPADTPVRLVRAYPQLVFDDNATAAAVTPDSDRRTVVAFQRGMIRVLPNDRNSPEASRFLDLREKMAEETEFEEGIHGLAFHPDFAVNRRMYLCFSQRGPRRTVLSEFMVPAGDALEADRRSERVLLELPHPLGNHWGGGIAFGPDGMLYLALGDGGLRDDPYRMGQNLWTLHGKILRIDVDGRSAGLSYRIPPDNPYVSRQESRDEIWASGLRNPWGLSFDRATGTLWCADVGQDRWEEVNLITRGGNYGWSERDGPERFDPRNRSPEEGGPFAGPVHFYSHQEGISITGGFVYRGAKLPSLRGNYLFGDWGVGKMWALSWDPSSGTATAVRRIVAPEDGVRMNPTVIACDAEGEPLIFGHYPSMIFTLEEGAALASAEGQGEADGLSPPEPVITEEPAVDDLKVVDPLDGGS